MKINDLKRKLDVEAWRIEARIWEATKKREDILAVLMYLGEKPRGADARGLARHLFDDDQGRRVAAERLLRITEYYGLTERDSKGGGQSWIYSLNEEGREALEKKEVPIPQDGTWEVALCDDSLLPHPVISLGSYPERQAKQEVDALRNKGKKNQRKDSFEELPGSVKRLGGIGKVIPHEGGSEVRIEPLGSKGERVAGEKGLSIRWDMSANWVVLEQGGSSVTEFPGPETIGVDEVWEAFLESEDLSNDWNGEKGSLAVSFDEIDDAERNSMRKGFKYKNPEIPGYGRFEDVAIEGVKIHARTEMDAYQWALWRLHQRVDSIASEDKYAGWCKEALEPFSGYKVALPKRDEYAKDQWESSHESERGDKSEQRKKAWHLIAALDWNI